MPKRNSSRRRCSSGSRSVAARKGSVGCERPPSCAPDFVPGATPEGRSHPMSCLVRRRRSFCRRARRRCRRWSRARPPACTRAGPARGRRAFHQPVKRRCQCPSSNRGTRGKQLVKHRTRPRPREHPETLYAYAHFLGESTRVRAQPVDRHRARRVTRTSSCGEPSTPTRSCLGIRTSGAPSGAAAASHWRAPSRPANTCRPPWARKRIETGGQRCCERWSVRAGSWPSVWPLVWARGGSPPIRSRPTMHSWG